MNDKERYLETILFGNPDKIPFQPGDPRESTLRNWHKQGLPENFDWQIYLRQQIGIEQVIKNEMPEIFLKYEMRPQYEEKIVEKKERSIIVQDWKGNICEISDEFDVSYLRTGKDFVTRKWIKCPVENRDDWENMKQRYNPNDYSRLPENIIEIGEKIKNRNYVIGFTVSGPFWQLREWLGFENLCMLFITAPNFVKEMIDFWKDYISSLLEKFLTYIKADYIRVSEDMAYKEKSMISPKMTKEYLLPCWKQWGKIIKSKGCPIYQIDSDGFIKELIPIWIEAGFNVTDPFEVAAGNDINEIRKIYGKKIAFIGGVDKRAIAKGGITIQKEMTRIKPVIKNGGYIPSCDHGVPSDVSWAFFVEYCEILAQMTGWK